MNEITWKTSIAIEYAAKAMGEFSVRGTEPDPKRYGIIAGSNELEKAQRYINEAVSLMNCGDKKIDQDICEFASGFHTLLRKGFDGNSSSLLYNKISELSGEWNNLLYHLQTNYKKSFEKLPISSLKIAAFEYQYSNYELQAAFEFFFLQNDVKGVEQQWKDWSRGV